MRTASLHTASLAGQALKYGGGADPAAQQRATLAAAGPAQAQAMLAGIRQLGFQTVTLWAPHCHWQHHSESDFPDRFKQLLAHGAMNLAGYTAALNVRCAADLDPGFGFARRLGAPLFIGPVAGLPDDQLLPLVQAACTRHRIRWAFVNQAERSAQEILARAGAGRFDRLGVSLDTFWCGVHGFDGLDTVKRLLPHLLAVNLRDVAKPGSRQACPLGEGVVPCEQIVRYLVKTDWQGSISLEYAPLDHDPAAALRRSLDRLKLWLFQG
jgi:sugar phosphate isomerase/epimerase